ncbi:MAG TPA: LuxR C-terminal-related transcriptional regulator [Phycisphaerales bacterium]|nr:LuxR C-terminal-related transcriptional regulator [Phycisphaerales bacterium]
MSGHDSRVDVAHAVTLPLSAFDASTLPVHVIGRSGTLYYTNNRGLMFAFGSTYSREQVIGRTLMELGPVEYYAERVRFIARLIDSNRVGVIRSLRNGKQTFVHVRPFPTDAFIESVALIVIESRAEPLTSAEVPGTEILNAAAQDLGPLAMLSPRELEVLAYVGMGLSVDDTAAKLHRSRETIISHRKSLMRKLGCSTASHLALIAVRAGLQPNDADKLKHNYTLKN